MPLPSHADSDDCEAGELGISEPLTTAVLHRRRYSLTLPDCPFETLARSRCYLYVLVFTPDDNWLLPQRSLCAVSLAHLVHAYAQTAVLIYLCPTRPCVIFSDQLGRLIQAPSPTSSPFEIQTAYHPVLSLGSINLRLRTPIMFSGRGDHPYLSPDQFSPRSDRSRG